MAPADGGAREAVQQRPSKIAALIAPSTENRAPPSELIAPAANER
jgi:hypothetical protein